MRQWITELLDRSSEELDPNDRYSDWTGFLEGPRHGPEKRELAARHLAEAGCDPEIEQALEQADDCEGAVYYFGHESAIVARMLANPRLQAGMLRAMAAVGVPFRGPVRIPARVLAPLLASANAEAVLLELLTQADFSEPANAIGALAGEDWRIQAFAALSEHNWKRLSRLLDSCPSDGALKGVVKLLLPSQIRQMPDSQALARITLEAALDGLRRDITQAGALGERLTAETAPAILDALFHRRFELASPPPYDFSNTKKAHSVLTLFQANPKAFAQSLGPNAQQRRKMLWDLFVKGFGYEEGLRRGHELDAALGLPAPKEKQ